MIGRLKKGFDVEDIYAVTGKEHKGTVRKQFPSLPEKNLILEPEMRDTAAAVGFAASFLQNKFPDEVMAAVWGADHLVKNEDEFIRALKLAEKLAIQKNNVVKVDVRPTFPSVHLGYVEIGKKIKEISGFGVYEFIRHVEKPDLKKANDYLDSGKYLWNTGYLVWKLSTIMNLYEKHMPSEFRILKEIHEESKDGREAKSLLREYKKIPKISIDYALFEKLGKDEQIVILADL
jgi:mannose-1-phosphate guanylyltransferase